MKEIILKYLTDKLTDLELEQLIDWLKKPKNLIEFQVLIKQDFNLSIVYDDIKEEDALQKVIRGIQNKEKPVKRLYSNLFKYAAAILIFVSAGYFFLTKDNPQITEPIIVNNNIKAGTDKAILTLDDGSTIALEKGETYTADNLSSNGEEIIYKPDSEFKSEIAYNYLTIPRGAQYFIKLSDGTQVWLNSESKLKYPVTFKEGEPRNVELVYGEAYFDVSSSTNHNGATFQVVNKGQNVEVLGTEFNIKAYKDETNIYTTLVEGKVAITYNKDRKKYLVPNQQSNYNIKTNELSMSTIDVFYEISWKDGVFSFENKSLKEIMKVLSRWYDIEVDFQNKNAANSEFIGSLSKNQSINEILSTIKNFGIIKEYKIENKKVTIK